MFEANHSLAPNRWHFRNDSTQWPIGHDFIFAPMIIHILNVVSVSPLIQASLIQKGNQRSWLWYRGTCSWAELDTRQLQMATWHTRRARICDNPTSNGIYIYIYIYIFSTRLNRNGRRCELGSWSLILVGLCFHFKMAPTCIEHHKNYELANEPY